MIEFLNSDKFKARFNEKEFKIKTEKETTISREKSTHWDPEYDDPKGDIVRYTIRANEEFSITDFKNYINYPFDELEFQLKIELSKFNVKGTWYKFDIYNNYDPISYRKKEYLDGVPGMNLYN